MYRKKIEEGNEADRTILHIRAGRGMGAEGNKICEKLTLAYWYQLHLPMPAHDEKQRKHDNPDESCTALMEDQMG